MTNAWIYIYIWHDNAITWKLYFRRPANEYDRTATVPRFYTAITLRSITFASVDSSGGERVYTYFQFRDKYEESTPRSVRNGHNQWSDETKMAITSVARVSLYVHATRYFVRGPSVIITTSAPSAVINRGRLQGRCGLLDVRFTIADVHETRVYVCRNRSGIRPENRDDHNRSYPSSCFRNTAPFVYERWWTRIDVYVVNEYLPRLFIIESDGKNVTCLFRFATIRRIFNYVHPAYDTMSLKKRRQTRTNTNSEVTSGYKLDFAEKISPRRHVIIFSIYIYMYT